MTTIHPLRSVFFNSLQVYDFGNNYQNICWHLDIKPSVYLMGGIHSVNIESGFNHKNEGGLNYPKGTVIVTALLKQAAGIHGMQKWAVNSTDKNML